MVARQRLAAEIATAGAGPADRAAAKRPNNNLNTSKGGHHLMVKITHTILLADEDDATRTFLHDNLSCDGYRIRPPRAAPRRSRCCQSSNRS